MAFNYRPQSEQDVLDLQHLGSKTKTIHSLYNKMRTLFPDDLELITIDTENGKTKVLRKFEGLIDLKSFQKEFNGLSLSIGDGSVSGKSPSTAQQEQITLKIFENLLGSSTPKYSSFDDMFHEATAIFPELQVNSDWYKSFNLQFTDLKKTTKLPNNKFDIYNRDNTNKGYDFMGYITDVVNSKYQITKKDSWNPADIWLLKSSSYKKYIDRIDESSSIFEVNEILREAYGKMDIVGVSLKKNNGKKLEYELVNLSSSSKEKEVTYKTYTINWDFDKKKKEFKSVTSKVSIQYDGKTYDMGVKSNQGAIGNVTFEFSGSGAAAFLGKVPKDLLGDEIRELGGHGIPQHADYNSFDKAKTTAMYNKIKSKSARFTIKGFNEFLDNMEMSWSKGRSKDNVINMQILEFAAFLASLSDKDLKEFSHKTFFLSQKKGKKFGPFGKLS